MSSSAAAIDTSVASPGSFRHTVLSAAKRFKSTWAELGKLLVKVRDEALYEQWGHASFEAYCAKELHIRKATADKLTRSFSFLAKHEPQFGEDEQLVQKAPAFEVVEVLADAAERGQLSQSEYRTIRDSIWDEAQPVAQLKREMTERFPRPAPPPPGASMQVRKLAAAARRLAAELAACKAIPASVSERAAALAEDVEGIASGMKDE
jgi:hypothetical protein